MTSGALIASPLLTRRERLWPVVIVSLAAHLAVIVAAALHRPAPRIDLQQKPIVAKLVRLGEKRPEHYLPRKEAAPPPAPAAAAPAPAPAPAPVAAAPAPPPVSVPATRPQPAPAPPRATATARAPAAAGPRTGASGKSDVLASVLSRVQRDKALSEPVYGDPNGDPRGDAEEGSGDQYLALVERSLRDSYVLPATISERERVSLRATVVLYLDSDGRVLRYAFETHSGNGAFDAALERAIRAARIPPPPPELRQKYRSEGLGVVYRP